MKVLIVSDTHGSLKNLDNVLKLVPDMDMFIHLGDVEGSEAYLNAVISCEKHIVRGNNDFFSEFRKEEEFYIGRYKVFITHGHGYYVSLNSEYIVEEGKARQDDIVMFGHTHKPFFREDKDLIALNPGSLSYPRQKGRKGTYMLMEVDEDEKLHFKQCFLD